MGEVIRCVSLVGMPPPRPCDRTDADLLRAMVANPRETAVGLADRAGVSRNTVGARLNRWDDVRALRGFDRRIDPAFLGYPMRAYVFTRVEQRKLDAVAVALAAIGEVLAVEGLSGDDDLLVHVAARDADDMYRVTGQILDVDGVVRTRTSLVMRELVEYRTAQLLEPQSRR